MEIIIHRYGSICEPDLVDAFRSCGITVIEESREIYQKSISHEERISELSKLILTHQTAFVFSINFFPYISEICERLRVLYVCLSVDCPVLELFSSSIRNKCNRIFLFDYMQYQRFCPENPECIFYLPLAVNTDRWEKVLAGVTKEDEIRYGSRISFVGSLYKEKSPLLRLSLDDYNRGIAEGIVESQVRVPEYSFLEDAVSESLIEAIRCRDESYYQLKDGFERTDAFVAAHYYLGMHVSYLKRLRILSELGKEFPVDLYTNSDVSELGSVSGIRCRGEVSTHREMPKVFYCSKINLNITMHSIQSGLPQRIWDVLGCGGFLLTDYQSEIPEYFTIGKELECYEDISELKEKAAYYLDHDDIRREIADNGFRKVKARHTYIHRVYSMLKTIFPKID